jgi:glutamate carboxypeptidase
MRKIIASLLTLIIASNSHAQLSDTEKKIITYLKEHMNDATAMLKESVNINSGSLNIEGVKKTGALFATALQKAGMQTEWVSLPDSVKRAGHLVATHKGKKGKKLFLIGHLDTVFEPDMPANPWTLLNDSTATGQGANDMKGGDVVIIMALQALNNMHLLDDATVVAYFTGDEESAGRPTNVSRKDFIERAKQCDIALGFEGAQGLHTVATARRGASGWKLAVTGTTFHSSGVFKNGYGAIYEAARILNEFREQLSNEQYLTFNPGLIAGGSDVVYNEEKASAQTIGKTNIVSPACYVTGDLRFLTEAQKENARAKMKAIVEKHLKNTNAKITFSDGIPAMEPTEGNNKLVTVLDKITKDLGIGETKAGDPGNRGAGDISYIAKYVDCLDGLGASGNGAHAPGETINLKEFPYLIQRAAILIYRLIKE